MRDPLSGWLQGDRLKKHFSGGEFNREIVVLILPQGYPFYPHRPYCICPESLHALLKIP